MSVQELKYFLAMRAMSQVGTKLDLVVRAQAAFQQKIPVRQDLSELEKELKNTYAKMLTEYKIPDPIKLPSNNWSEDVSLWPRVDLGKIFAFVIEKKAYGTEYIGQYKAKKAYSHFMSGFVHKIFVKLMGGDKVLLKGQVTPSQKLREDPRDVWLLCSRSGAILCAYCSCTAGFAECCNHVIAIAYKVEFANARGLIDPACTDMACSWNRNTQREVQFTKIKNATIKKHDVMKRTKRRLVQSEVKMNYDPRPVEVRDKCGERGDRLCMNVRDEQPLAVVLKCEEPPAKHGCPKPLPVIGEEIYEQREGKTEQELVKLFSERLSFSESQLKELERSTRAQAGSLAWKEQRVGCITASKIKDVCSKVEELSKSRNKAVKTTPLLSRMFKDFNLDFIPAVKYGRNHEKDARKAFAENEVKKHQNGRLLDCGLIASKSFPFIRATPDNIFICRCCDANVPVEYKCPFKIREKSVAEAYGELDFLEQVNGSIQLKRKHKYYSQVTAQTALLEAKHAFFVVWTPAGELFVEKIPFDKEHWSLLERNAILFFNGYVARVLIKQRTVYFCRSCDKPVLEPKEFDNDTENSIECSSCQLWYHWSCVNVKTNPKGDWICSICIQEEFDGDINII